MIGIFEDTALVLVGNKSLLPHMRGGILFS